MKKKFENYSIKPTRVSQPPQELIQHARDMVNGIQTYLEKP